MRALAVAGVLAVLTVACTGSEPVEVTAPAATTEATEVTASPAATAVAATPVSGQTAAGSPAATPSTPIPSVTQPPRPTPSPTRVGPPEPREGDESGVPFSTVDVRVAVEDGRGYSFWLVEQERPTLCPASAVPGRPYWSSNLLGSDFGPVFVLWVYPDALALEADWDVEPGEVPAPRFDCDLPSGFVYWNENLILAFDVWLSLGEPLPLHEHWESPSDMPAVEAFLELAP